MAKKRKKSGWSASQITSAQMAGKEVGLNRAQRQMILGCCGTRAMMDGEITSTSEKLTNADFEYFMSVCESKNEGRIGNWGFMHFTQKMEVPYIRLRFKIQRYGNQLEHSGLINLMGLIYNATEHRKAGQTDNLDLLEWRYLNALITVLRKIAYRAKVKLID